jgi:hypothetical protein
MLYGRGENLGYLEQADAGITLNVQLEPVVPLASPMW